MLILFCRKLADALFVLNYAKKCLFYFAEYLQMLFFFYIMLEMVIFFGRVLANALFVLLNTRKWSICFEVC